jgi:hypothetical protein
MKTPHDGEGLMMQKHLLNRERELIHKKRQTVDGGPRIERRPRSISGGSKWPSEGKGPCLNKDA